MRIYLIVQSSWFGYYMYFIIHRFRLFIVNIFIIILKCNISIIFLELIYIILKYLLRYLCLWKFVNTYIWPTIHSTITLFELFIHLYMIYNLFLIFLSEWWSRFWLIYIKSFVNLNLIQNRNSVMILIIRILIWTFWFFILNFNFFNNFVIHNRV